MKSFLLFSASVVLCGSMSFAQENLFPELDMGEEEMMAPISETIITSKEPAVPAEIVADQPVNNEVSEDEEESEEEKNEKIYITLNNIKTNVTQVRAVSNCQADFVVLNAFKKRKVDNFDITVKIGDTEENFQFSGLAPQKPDGRHIIIVGKDCESILSQPKTNVTKCKIPGVTEKKCKEKVVYVTPEMAFGAQN